MNALIFAAGLGTRLKPLTDTMPKAMVPVGGKPLVQILIERLKAIGVGEIVINVHHFAQQIIDFVEANDSFGLDIHFSDETQQLLETGGGLKKAAPLFSTDSPILVHNVDILSNADLASLYAQSVESHLTTLLVSQRPTQRYLLFNADDNLVGWVNMATGQVKSPFDHILRHEGDPDYFRTATDLRRYAFAGIQVFQPSMLPLMDAWQGRFSIIDFYLSVCDKVAIRCLPSADLRLLDVGKLDTITQAEAFVARQR